MNAINVQFDVLAEQAVLGAIFFDPNLLGEALMIIKASDFKDQRHRAVFAAMLDAEKSGSAIDEVTIGDALSKQGSLQKIGGFVYLAELVDHCPSSLNIKHYSEIVKQQSLLTQFSADVEKLSQALKMPNAKVDELVTLGLGMIERAQEVKVDDLKTLNLKDEVNRFFEELSKKEESKTALPGLSTGFKTLDDFLGGIEPGEYVVLAARPSMGKTAMAIGMAVSVAEQTTDKTALIFSAEQTADKIVRRVFAQTAQVNATKIKFGNLNDSEWDSMSVALSKITNHDNIMLNDRMTDVDQIVFEAKRLHRIKPLSIILVDYLQLLDSTWDKPGTSREEVVRKMSAKFKKLGKDLRVPVVALSQLNRNLENRNNKRPFMADLRDSGAIEQDADTILFIYRDEVYNANSADRGRAEIIIGKARDGQIGTVMLGFEPCHVRFFDLQKSSAYPPLDI